jgi:Group 4 capsule polysaccharide lipoprotein gfcB, YjbF
VRRPQALAAALLLAGCTSAGTSDYQLYYQALRRSIADSFGTARITRDQAAAIPYASMGYRLNGGPERLLVLATDSNGEQLWTSASHIVIVTRGGRIVRTVGLAHNISGVTPQQGQDMPALASALKGGVTSTRRVDFPDIPAYDVAVTCKTTYRGMETIIILGRGITTQKIDETCQSPRLNWSFTDSYWLDPGSGMVWRSIQHIDPKNGRVETEILRPPS